MDEYQEQQAMEIEALESILMDDLEGKNCFTCNDEHGMKRRF